MTKNVNILHEFVFCVFLVIYNIPPSFLRGGFAFNPDRRYSFDKKILYLYSDYQLTKG
jgi:hypothetical protein